MYHEYAFDLECGEFECDMFACFACGTRIDPTILKNKAKPVNKYGFLKRPRGNYTHYGGKNK